MTRTVDFRGASAGANVVNYGSATLSKIRTADMTVLQEVNTQPTRQRVWVATYDGVIEVYADTRPTDE